MIDSGASNNSTTDAVKLSVIAPCYNEEGNIDELVERTLRTFDQLGVSAELILVDDGSSDKTLERIRHAASKDGRVRAVPQQPNQGMVPAWRIGLAAATGERVCLIDSDLQNRPEDIARLYEAHSDYSFDIIQAVRHPASSGRRLHLFSRGLNLLLNAAFLMWARDNKSGFIVCRKQTLSAILRHRFRYRYFQCLIGVSARSRGFSIGEIDTVFDKRRSGCSFLSRFPLLVALRTGWELLKFRLESLVVATGKAQPSRPVAGTAATPIIGSA